MRLTTTQLVRRWLLGAGTLALLLAGILVSCERRKVDGCERLFEQRRRCLSVYHGKKQFVHRCRNAGMKAGLDHQVRCAQQPSCAAFRKCLKRSAAAQPPDMTPELYRALRPAPRPAAPR